MTKIEITLDDKRISNLKTLLQKRDMLAPVIVAANEATGDTGSEIHQAIDRTRNSIDASIVKLLVGQLSEALK